MNSTPHMHKPYFPFFRRLLPVTAAQFFSAFNENAFKILTATFIAGGFRGSFSGELFLLALTMVYAVPALLLQPLAGFLADRLPKRYTMLLTKLFELGVLIYAALSLDDPGAGTFCPAIAAMLLISVQSIFFMPAATGLLPEEFQENEISRANGIFSAASFAGMLLGVCAVPLLLRSGMTLPQILRYLAGISLLSFISILFVTHTISEVQKHREWAYSLGKALRYGWGELTRTGALFLAALGDAVFMALSIATMLILVFFARFTLPDGLAWQDAALFQVTAAAGLIAGCSLAGRICRKKIELGIVPFGAAGVALFLVLGVFCPGNTSSFTLTIPNVFSHTFLVFPLALFYFFLAGVNGGFFLVPLRAFVQQRVRPARRGAAMAAVNTLRYAAILLINALVLALALGAAKDSPDLPQCLREIAASLPSAPVTWIIASIAGMTVAVTFVTMWMLPDFALRFLILTLGNLCYRIRSAGTEYIPERGAALLVANHVSYIDNILISSCTSRRVRFLMHEEFFANPLIRFIARLTGFIKVPGSGHRNMQKMFDEVREALRNGDIVCVFPEGQPTHTGTIGRFGGGYKHMLPDDMDVPVIPVNLGRLWGSIFSHYRGPVQLRKPKEFPYFATVTFGAPVPKDMSAFEVRQRIAELAAETAKQEMPHEHPVHYMLGKNAKRHPFQVIMRDAHDGNSYTFFKAYLASILFSRVIRKINPSDSKYVGVLLPNSTAAALSIMGTLLADKVPCPLNFTMSQDVLEYSIRKAKMKVVLTSRRFLDKVRLKPTPEMVFLEDIAPTIPMWRKIVTMLGIIFLPYRELLNMVAPLSYDNNSGEAVLLFSSGSTGIPKGVILTHHNIYSDIRAMIQCIAYDPRRDTIFGNLPLFHSFGMNTGLWLPYIIRSQPVVYVHSPLDANLIGEAIAKYKVNILVVTPSFLQTYLRKFKPEQFEPLRLVVSGAEKLRQDIADKFREQLGGRLELVEGYGCTELSPVVTVNVSENVTETGAKAGKKGAIGLPLETICARIVDPITFKPVPPESEGLLFVKGPTVMQGYLDDPQQTAEVMFGDYYNTGDIAKMDEDGYVTICGRLSRFSKIAGEMVPHEMIETIINEMCGLEERVVAVTSIPDQQKGEALLVLYTPAMPYTPDQIVEQLRERSISNLWIPKATNFRAVEQLPLLGSGKLDLTILRKTADEVAAERAAGKGA